MLLFVYLVVVSVIFTAGSQALECEPSHSLMNLEGRLATLNYVNNLRQQAKNGTLQLIDNKFALPAKDMKNLVSYPHLTCNLKHNFCRHGVVSWKVI